MGRLGAYFHRDHLVARGAFGRLTARDQVGAWSADGIFEDIGDEGGEEDRDDQAEDGDVDLMSRRASHGGPEYEEDEGNEEGVDEEPC